MGSRGRRRGASTASLPWGRRPAAVQSSETLSQARIQEISDYIGPRPLRNARPHRNRLCRTKHRAGSRRRSRSHRARGRQPRRVECRRPRLRTRCGNHAFDHRQNRRAGEKRPRYRVFLTGRRQGPVFRSDKTQRGAPLNRIFQSIYFKPDVDPGKSTNNSHGVRKLQSIPEIRGGYRGSRLIRKPTHPPDRWPGLPTFRHVLDKRRRQPQTARSSIFHGSATFNSIAAEKPITSQRASFETGGEPLA